MPRSRKEKRQHYDSAPEQRARVIKSGIYDGSNSSRDFVVSGHSTGSANTEMEALSHQVSIDAGRVPDYPLDDSFIKSDLQSAEDERDDQKIEQFYSSPLSGSTLAPYKKIALWGSLGAAGAALSYLAYRYYEDYKLKKLAEPIFDY